MLFFEDDEQEWWGESRDERLRRSRADHYDGEDVAKRLFGMAVLWLLSGVLLISAVTAIVSASVFVITAQLCRPGLKPNYVDTFLASFKGTLVLTLVGGLLALVTMLLMPSHMRTPILKGLASLFGLGQTSGTTPPDTTATWLWLVVLGVPAVAAYAGTMSQRIRGPFSGAEGYALSLCTSVVGLGLGLGLPILGVNVVNDQLHSNPGGLRHLILSVLVASVSLFVYAVLGALLAGFILFLHARILSSARGGAQGSRRPSFGHAYTAALLTLPLHSVTTALCFIALTSHNPFRTGLWPVPHGGALLLIWQTQPIAELANIIIRLLVAQTPGILLGALIVSMRLGGPYRGPRGFSHALIATTLSMTFTAAAATAALASVGF